MAKKTTIIQGSLMKPDVPEMPEGYYSGDKPNPNLRAFVGQHMAEHPYDPATDTYDVPAFDHPIMTTKANAIYNMHTYWSKKPHDAICQYIQHYTQPGDLILDPFCGSGSTIYAALIEGRAAVAVDRSPAATFIAKNYCTPVDTQALRQAFEDLKARLQPEIDWLYETRCDRCGGKATTGYTVYSQVFQCPRCLEKVPLYDCKDMQGQAQNGAAKTIAICPRCYDRGTVEEISTRTKPFGAVPVLVTYLCQAGCKPARGERTHNDHDVRKRDFFQRYDLLKIAEIEANPIPHWFPVDKMMHVEDDTKPWGAEWREGRNFRSVADLFTKRNLWGISAIREQISRIGDDAIRDALLFGLTGVLLNCSRMYREREQGRGTAKGNYYTPPLAREMVVTNGWYYKIEQHVLPGLEEINNSLKTTNVCISTESAVDLRACPAHSVDYVFTDPPYAGKIQYGELNFVWESWLGLDTYWHDEEIIVNEVRGKSEADWADMMRRAMAECYRVLKPGRWLSLCYHGTSRTWAMVQDIMAEIGFLVDSSDSALYIDTGQKTYNQYTADNTAKRDLVINFRKPRLGEVVAALTITGDEDSTTFSDKVRTIVRDYLVVHPGETKDRIYDEVVSRMVRAGQMEAHNFENLLAQVAEETVELHGRGRPSDGVADGRATYEIHRWYLKDVESDGVDAAESAKEDLAAMVLRSFIEVHMEAQPDLDGIHYSNLFERYVYGVKDKPRRELVDWLPDYFFRTPSGGYRPPASEGEERAKAAARAAGVNRHIKRYLAYIKQGVAIPERERQAAATLAEWVRQCKRTGLYEEGKLLYEQGGLTLDALSEEQQVEVEEDYGVCVRMRERAGAAPPAKRGKTAMNPQLSLPLL